MGTGSQAAQPVQTTQTTSGPWAGVQPYLGLMYSGASALQQGGTAGLPYQGPTQAPLDPNIQQGLATTQGLASGQLATQNPALYNAMNQLGGLGNNQGLTPWVANAANQGLGNDVMSQYNRIYNQAQGATNPYLQASIADQNRRGNEAIQSSMSAAGRYGSGQYQDVMARAQAEVADPLLMQDYQARQQQALQATQGAGQTYGQMAGIYQQGLGQSLQAMGMMPNMMQAQYTPAQEQLAGGQYMQDYNQQVLQGQIAEYNAMQQYPWTQLQQEAGILQGAGTVGGQQVTAQTPLQASLAQRLMGGALVGGGLGSTLGPAGTAGGAGLGALAGAFL